VAPRFHFEASGKQKAEIDAVRARSETGAPAGVVRERLRIACGHPSGGGAELGVAGSRVQRLFDSWGNFATGFKKCMLPGNINDRIVTFANKHEGFEGHLFSKTGEIGG
jgi:hypothetical protein